MKEKKILIFGLEKMPITNKNTGEVKLYTKVHYLIELGLTENYIGHYAFTSTCSADAFTKLQQFKLKEVVGKFSSKPNEKKNGTIDYLEEINGIKLR